MKPPRMAGSGRRPAYPGSAIPFSGPTNPAEPPADPANAKPEPPPNPCGNCGGPHRTADCPIPPDYDGDYTRDSGGSAGCNCA